MTAPPRRAAPFRRAVPAAPRGLAALLLALSLLLAAGFGTGAVASPQAQGLHSRVRLLSGGERDGRRLAGVEIVLDRGFKTYWRNPGESGLPPRFDWAGSRNAAAVDVLWPAPARTQDAGGVAYTYADRVVFPVLITPEDPKAPVRLELALEYGVCKEICIPARAELSLDLAEDPVGEGRIRSALARVPKPQPVGAAGDLSVLAAEPLPSAAGKPRIAVTVRAPEGAAPTLFPEPPDNWFLSAERGAAAAGPGTHRFVLAVEERPKDSSGPLPLRLTLVAGDRAVETDVTLPLPPP